MVLSHTHLSPAAFERRVLRAPLCAQARILAGEALVEYRAYFMSLVTTDAERSRNQQNDKTILAKQESVLTGAALKQLLVRKYVWKYYDAIARKRKDVPLKLLHKVIKRLSNDDRAVQTLNMPAALVDYLRS